MAYPPTPPPTGRSDSTPLPTNHPDDHNAISTALTDIINELGSNPKGDQASLTARLDIMAPAGIVVPYAGATAPAGWQLCDGTAISRATYATLFTLIGTTYGAGDGSTTFNVPDLRSRFVAGKGTATWSDALNETGGSKDAVAVAHTHTSTDHSHTWSGTTSGQSASHTHAGNDNGFVYWSNSYGSGWAAWPEAGSVVALSWQASTGSASADHTHTYSGTTSGASTGNTTASQSPTSTATDTNLPPYLTLNHIIRLG